LFWPATGEREAGEEQNNIRAKRGKKISTHHASPNLGSDPMDCGMNFLSGKWEPPPLRK